MADIELKKDGIKTEYRRFLSDSAVGGVAVFVLLIFSALPDTYGYEIIFKKLFTVVKFDLQSQIFFYLILFILITPIGLTINAFSWFIIGNFFEYCSDAIVVGSKLNFLINSSKNNFMYDTWRKKYAATFECWQKSITLIEQRLKTFYPEVVERYEYAHGHGLFCRSLCVIFSVAIPLFAKPSKGFLNELPSYLLISVIVCTFFFLLSILVFSFRHLALACSYYLLAEDEDIEDAKKEKEININIVSIKRKARAK